MHNDPHCPPSCYGKHFHHFCLDSHEPWVASVLSHGNYSLLPWQNNNSLNKEHNTDELSDFATPSPPPFSSFHFFQICFVLLIHFSNHPTPALRLSKMKHPIWGPICWMILSHRMHVHKPVFYAKALTTPSWPICSLFVYPIFCLSSISLSLSLALCWSSYFSWLSWFVTLMPFTQTHACLYQSVLYAKVSCALESDSVLQRLLQLLSVEIDHEHTIPSAPCVLLSVMWQWYTGEEGKGWNGARWREWFELMCFPQTRNW